MAENIYERVNDYSSVKVTLASPNDFCVWSLGMNITLEKKQLEAGTLL